jgi:glutaredoxin
MNKIIVTIIIVLIVLAFIHFYFNCNEPFESDVSKEILIFVSETCPHCVDYKDKMHQNVLNTFKDDSSVNVKLITSGENENSNNLFSKYDVQFVPACVILKGNKAEKLDKMITPENLQEKIDSM